MRIIKATDAIPVEHPVFMLFGQPGICKTSLAYSTTDPLLLDFDNGAHRAVNRRDTVPIVTWADLKDLSDGLEPYQTVIVDTVGRCLDVMTVDIIANNPKMGRDGNLTQQGWGVLKGRFRTWMAQLRSMGKDVLLIAHDKEDKDGDSRIVRPDIVGGSYGEVMKVSDFVGYLYMNGKDRILDFNPTDRWVGKNPGGWKPLVVPPIGKAQSFLGGLYEEGRAALGAISEESAKVMAEVAEWRTKIENFTTVEEVNAAIPETNKLPAIVAPQVKKILADKAKALKFEFDAKAKKYAEPVTA